MRPVCLPSLAARCSTRIAGRHLARESPEMGADVRVQHGCASNVSAPRAAQAHPAVRPPLTPAALCSGTCPIGRLVVSAGNDGSQGAAPDEPNEISSHELNQSGIFDHGFESYRTVPDADYHSL